MAAKRNPMMLLPPRAYKARVENSIKICHIFVEPPPKSFYQRLKETAVTVYRFFIGTKPDTPLPVQAIEEGFQSGSAPVTYTKFEDLGTKPIVRKRVKTVDFAAQATEEDLEPYIYDKHGRDKSARLLSPPADKKPKRGSTAINSRPPALSSGLFLRSGGMQPEPEESESRVIFNAQQLQRLRTGTCSSQRFMQRLEKVRKPAASPHSSDLSCPATPEQQDPPSPVQVNDSPPDRNLMVEPTPVSDETQSWGKEAEGKPSPTPLSSINDLVPVALFKPLIEKQQCSIENQQMAKPTDNQPIPKSPEPEQTESSEAMMISLERKPATPEPVPEQAKEQERPPQSPVTLPLTAINTGSPPPGNSLMQGTNPFLSPDSASIDTTGSKFVFGKNAQSPSNTPELNPYSSLEHDMEAQDHAPAPAPAFPPASSQFMPFNAAPQLLNSPPMGFGYPPPTVFHSAPAGIGFNLGVIPSRKKH